MTKFEIADITTSPGELKFGRLPVLEMRDGTQVSVPLMVLHGVHEGPKLWVDAASHGDEIAGVEVIRRVVREEVDPKDLHGIIVAAPALNPWAFLTGTHSTPLYGSSGEADINKVFPGKPNGTAAERMAHRILTQGALKCDYVISFHSNFFPAVEFAPITVCEDPAVLKESLALAEAFGFPLSEVKKGEGWSILACQRAGKPAILAELLAQGYLDKRSIQLGVDGVLNALRHLKMLEGKPQPLKGLKVPPGRYGRGFVTCGAGGLIHFRKEAGDWLDTGDVIAIVRNIFGDVVEEVKAPLPGYIRTILFGPHNEAIHEGAIIASILEADPDRRYFED